MQGYPQPALRVRVCVYLHVCVVWKQCTAQPARPSIYASFKSETQPADGGASVWLAANFNLVNELANDQLTGSGSRELVKPGSGVADRILVVDSGGFGLEPKPVCSSF